MLTILEYLITIGGTILLFLYTKKTNMGVQQFTLYLCVIIVWSIAIYAIMYLLNKMDKKSS